MHRELGTRLGEQFGEAGDRQWHPVRIDAALEPRRRLRAQAVAGDGPTDPDRLEPRHLERDDAGVVADLGVESAHHTGEPADRTILAVADQQVGAAEDALLTVERGDPLALVRGADAEAAAARVVRS